MLFPNLKQNRKEISEWVDICILLTSAADALGKLQILVERDEKYAKWQEYDLTVALGGGGAVYDGLLEIH